ncbi:MAG: hypothetical protein JO041_08275 [Acidobacteria bacterium]|nr:hypothetical protein [Acidobacteriota bacterium]
MESKVVERLHDPDLRLYIVWVAVKHAQQPAELAANAAREAQAFRRAGVLNYVDPQSDAAAAFALPLNLQRRMGVQLPAWDVYLSYSRGARWDSQGPPPPAFWMHQLSNAPGELWLNPERLRAEVQRMLDEKSSKL